MVKSQIRWLKKTIHILNLIRPFWISMFGIHCSEKFQDKKNPVYLIRNDLANVSGIYIIRIKIEYSYVYFNFLTYIFKKFTRNHGFKVNIE